MATYGVLTKLFIRSLFPEVTSDLLNGTRCASNICVKIFFFLFVHAMSEEANLGKFTLNKNTVEIKEKEEGATKTICSFATFHVEEFSAKIYIYMKKQ